jgi:hypothetical protein
MTHAPPYTFTMGATWNSPGGRFACVDLNAVGAYYFDIEPRCSTDDSGDTQCTSFGEPCGYALT